MSGHRLHQGGSIDRSRPLRFTFDGKAYKGFAGDTLASALLANGVSVVARSFKYHRPRGFLSAGPEEPNGLLTVGSDGRSEPNTKATMVDLHDGLVATSQHCWPGLSFDLGAINGLFGSVFSAGFYYKTFMGPGRKAWMFYEHFIRRAAGLGPATSQADPDRYERLHVFTDVLVVGSGPAGLMAAYQAASAGKRVILAEERAIACASLVGENSLLDGKPASAWRQEILEKLLQFPKLRLLPGTMVYGYYGDDTFAAVEQLPAETTGKALRQRHHTIHAKEVVIATGAIERPIVFANNDLPGIMLASAISTYIRQYAVAPAPAIAIYTTHDGTYSLVREAIDAGIEVVAVIDPRSKIGGSARQIIDDTGIDLLLQCIVTRARGRHTLKSIEIASLAEDGVVPLKRITVSALAVSAGWTPTIHLPSQNGEKPEWNDEIAAFIPGQPQPHWQVAGAAAGSFALAACLREGSAAGIAAAGVAEAPVVAVPAALVGPVCSHPFALDPLLEASRGKAFVDFQNDVMSKDLMLAHAEGFRSVEHAKRYTTLGMGTDQGKTSNISGMAIIAALEHKPIPDIGTTRYRPPYSPVTLGALVGSRRGADFRPLRRSPMHNWHTTHGGDMLAAGLWMRPQAYRNAGESLELASLREARNVRENVGIVDVSTLGKIDVQGPDAAEFLNRVYINNWLKLEVGKARYGLMLREDGFVFDDGTCWRLSEQQFLMTTTTANAAAVLVHLEFLLNIVWPELKVHVSSLTDRWAGMAVAGPKSRSVLQAAVQNIDMSNEAFPLMHFREASVDGVPVLVARLSFSGELAFEVFVDPQHAAAVWETLLEAGQTSHILPYGTEALGILRIEKGHISGPELDGRTTAADLGFGRMCSQKKTFVGSAMLGRAGLVDTLRHRLVGLVSMDGTPVRGGSQIVDRDTPTAGPVIGHVTSSCYSPALEKNIALALVRSRTGPASGRQLYASYPLRAQHTPVTVVDPCFYDPDGSRMRG